MSRINLSSLTGSETQSHSPELSSNQSSSTPSVKQILALFRALPDSSKAEFIRQILSNSTQSSSIQTNNKPTETLESLRFPEQIYCPHCKKTNIVTLCTRTEPHPFSLLFCPRSQQVHVSPR